MYKLLHSPYLYAPPQAFAENNFVHAVGSIFLTSASDFVKTKF
jgi:hypothetical protein